MCIEELRQKQKEMIERSWPEDYHHENGQYYNTCLECTLIFVGYKRRHICKSCAVNPVENP